MDRAEKINAELQKLKAMNYKQRLRYVWDYYKLGFVILVVVIVFISMVSTMVKNLTTQVLLNGMVFNCDYMNGDTAGLEQQFEAYLGGLEPKEKINLDFTVTIDPENWSSAQTAAETKITAYNMEGSLDCMVMPEAVYEYYQEQGMFCSLEGVLTAEELNIWSEDLVYVSAAAEAGQPEEEQPEEEQVNAGQPEEEQPDKVQSDEVQPDKAQTDEAQADEAQTDEAQTDEAQTDEAQTDEAQIDKTQTDKTQLKTELPYGVRITSSKALAQYGLYQEGQSLVFAFPGNTSDFEYAKYFLHFLMEQ